MSEVRDYCVCTSRPASYAPLLGAATSSAIDVMACAVETRDSTQELATKAEPPRPTNGEQKSILYGLLSARDTPPSLSSAVMHDDGAGMGDSMAKMLSAVDPSAYRIRSDSFNSAIGCGVATLSRASSGDSLASSVGGQGKLGGQSEALDEATLSRLVHLSTDNDAALLAATQRSRSQPGTPPSPVLCPEVRRKYSMGSRMARMQPPISELAPVDLSCKRTRYAESSATSTANNGGHSILKSILTVSTIRERSNTLAVCGTRGLASSQASRQQHVALAKKTLLPVSARVAELLKRSVEFARSLPEFLSLPANDRRSLLASGMSRLLVLYMAEENLQFAVTPTHDDEPMLMDCEPVSARLADVPTQQFVEGVQNLIRKCQLLQISANEFFYMRMITLFHTGSSCGILDRAEDIERLGSEARQDLQDLTRHHRPSERLRYSNLLLTLHTVFGINAGMLSALFCRQLPGFSGAQLDFSAYARQELDDPTTC